MIMLDYPGPDAESIQGQWRGLENMRKEGGVTSLAVSNFSPRQLDVVLKSPGGKPTVNQSPLGVGYKTKQNADLLKENKKRASWCRPGRRSGYCRRARFKRVRGRRPVRQDAPANRAEVDSRQGRDATCWRRRPVTLPG